MLHTLRRIPTPIRLNNGTANVNDRQHTDVWHALRPSQGMRMMVREAADG